jgi:diguanylate cyclase (GGDEF)-like protein
MTTESIFDASVVLTSLLLLLATTLVANDDGRITSVRALRVFLLANALSWAAFIMPGRPLQLLSWTLATLAYCSVTIFCSRRAGLPDPWRYLAVVMLLTCSSFAWFVFNRSTAGIMYTSSAVFFLALAPALRDLARKPDRSRSDVFLGCILLAILVVGAARSAIWLSAVGSFAGTGRLDYVLMPTAYLGIGIFALTGYMEETYRQMRDLALFDPLTGLLNRRGYTERAASHFANASRRRLPMTAASLDIDHFKSINDRHGHEVGDAAIRRLSSTLASTVREGDVAARFGGEEFLVLLPYATQEHALALMSRVREALRSGFEDANEATAPAFTVSIGIATQEFEHDSERLALAADAAMYQAKRNGRDRIEFAQAPSIAAAGSG